MTRRRTSRIVITAAVALAFVSVGLPAAAQTGEDDYDHMAEGEDDEIVPVSPGDGEVPGAGPAADPVSQDPASQGPVCEWTSYDVDDPAVSYGLGYGVVGAGLTMPDRPSDEHVLQIRTCDEPGWEPTQDDIQWVDPNAEDEPDEAALAAQLGEDLYARVRGNLPEPEISANPAEGQPWFVNVPVFVRIDNWEDDEAWDGTFTDQECDSPDFCAYVEAHPTMVFDPGDGTGQIDCEPPGVLFSGTTNDEVFELHESPESCSHIYELRSGDDGRPEEWPGEVAIVWTIDWWDDAGGSGTYEEPVTNSASLAREINEVNAVVTD